MASKKISKEIISIKYLNKFTITILLFGIWMMFFDTNNLLTQRKLTKIVNELDAEKSKFEALYGKAVEEKKTLESDQEKYAREKYFMHKDNEEIFIINNKQK